MCSAFFLFSFFFFKKWFCLQVSREPIKEQLLTICGPHSLHFFEMDCWVSANSSFNEK